MAYQSSSAPSERTSGRGGNPNLVFVSGALLVLLALLITYIATRQQAGTSLLQSLPAAVVADSEQPSTGVVSASGNAVATGSDADLKDVLAKPLETKTPIKKEEPKPEEVKTEPPMVSVDTAKAPKPAAEEEPAAVEAQFNGQSEYSYTVRGGETLYRIASRFRNPASQIKTNNALETDQVQVGQAVKLKIQGIHKVAPSEGLTAIARAYGVTVSDLKKANELASDELKEGQALIVPLP